MVGFCVAGAKRGFILEWAQRYLDVAKKASGPLAVTLTSAQADAARLQAEVGLWKPVHAPNRLSCVIRSKCEHPDALGAAPQNTQDRDA